MSSLPHTCAVAFTAWMLLRFFDISAGVDASTTAAAGIGHSESATETTLWNWILSRWEDRDGVNRTRYFQSCGGDRNSKGCLNQGGRACATSLILPTIDE